MDERDGDIVPAKIAVKACAAADEFIDFPGDLDAAETPSDDDEMEVPAPPIPSGRSLGLFHMTYQMLAKIDPIAHDLKGKSVIGHSLNLS